MKDASPGVPTVAQWERWDAGFHPWPNCGLDHNCGSNLIPGQELYVPQDSQRRKKIFWGQPGVSELGLCIEKHYDC